MTETTAWERQPRPVLTNLPVRRMRLIGRDASLKNARDLVLHGDMRLVTLVGPPGAGKTSLGFELAREIAEDFPDGAWHVGLELADADADLANLCGAALGLVEDAESEPIASLQNHLQPRQLLLLLDNCEHVSAACARLLDTLLSNCPDLRVLATSRSPLRLRDEATLMVEPLELPDPGSSAPLHELAGVPAVTLFLERARAVRNAFELTDENASAVVEICRRLEGLPLALELAAARVVAFSPQQIAERLASSELRRVRPFLNPPRHETLMAALKWSYDLLSAREQQLFRRLGALPPGWTLEAAEEISHRLDGNATDVMPTLAALVDQSLIIAGDEAGASRYRTLMPIREFAVERLREAEELPDTLRAHARYNRRLAEQVSETRWAAPSLSPEQLGKLQRQHESLLASLRWAEHDGDGKTALRICLTLWVFWRIRGDLRTAANHLHASLGVGGDASPGLRAMAMLEASNFAQLVGESTRAEELANEALAFFRDAEEPHGEAYALALLGDVALDANHAERAGELYWEACRVGDAAKSASVAAWSLGGLSAVAEQRGHDEKAESRLEQALGLLETPDAPRWLKARFEAQLARLVRRRGDHARAADLLRQAVRLLQPLEARNELSPCIEELARTASGEGQLTRAALLFGAANALRESTGGILGDKAAQELASDVEAVRKNLGERRFTAAWTKGRDLSLQDAAAFALAEEAPEAELTPESPLAVLTRREREVAQLVAEGLTNAGIAERLVVSEGTARTHVDRILRKLGCRSRVGIATVVAEEAAAGS